MGCCKSKPKPLPPRPSPSTTTDADVERLFSVLRRLEYQAASNDTDSDLRGAHFAKVVKVYDGDTVTLALIDGGRHYQVSARLAHIDTAEMRINKPQKESQKWTTEELRVEKEEADAAKAYLLNLLPADKVVYAVIQKRDGYRRCITELYLPDEADKPTEQQRMLNMELVNAGHALLYEGKGERCKTGMLLRAARQKANRGRGSTRV